MLFKTRLPNVQVYGSIHLWDDTPVVLSDEAADAYRSAQRLVFEVDYRVAPDLQIAARQDGRRLSEVLPSDLADGMRAAEKEFGLPANGMENLKPWAAAILHILPHQFRRAGFSNARGIDVRFFEQAMADGKSVDSFETLTGQLSFFDSAPAAEQETFLRRSILPAAVDEAARLFKGYRERDFGVLEGISAEALRLMPKLFTTLTEERNISWRQRILQEFDDGVPTLVVAGVLHCIGPTGIQNL